MKNFFGYDPDSPAAMEPVEIAPRVIISFMGFLRRKMLRLQHLLL